MTRLRWTTRWGHSHLDCDYLRDVGCLHILDWRLARATNELAKHSRRWPFWHHNPFRYRDIDGDTYA